MASQLELEQRRRARQSLEPLGEEARRRLEAVLQQMQPSLKRVLAARPQVREQLELELGRQDT